MMRRIICLCFSLLALTAGNRALAQENEPLTFGVISDIHFGNGVGEGPMVKVPQALKNLTSQGRLDVLAVVGDLANSGAASEYEQLVGVFQDEKNFTNPVGSFLFMMGNHDNFNSNGKSNYQEGLKAFNGGEPYPYHIYTVIKGYPFITISEFSGDSSDTNSPSSGTAAYPADNVALLESYLERASQECPGKPIFVFTHVPPRWTVYGSWPELETGSAWAMQVLNPVLNKYPQAVVFSGHSHYPLGDPRSIHQGVNPDSPRQNYYTVINTASTTYSEINPGAVDAGIHPTGYDYVTEGLILTELPNGDIEIRRYDTYRNLEIGADNRWVLKAPFDGSMFQYGDIRDADDNPYNRPLRDGHLAPEFTESAQLGVKSNAHKVEVTIPQAMDDEDFVFRYRVRLSKAGLVVGEKFIFSQFYLNTEMPETLTCTFTGLEANSEYSVEVVAMDCYDKMSAPLTLPFTTAASSIGDEDLAPDARWTFDDPNDLLKVEKGDYVLQPISVGRGSVTIVESADEVGITAIAGQKEGDGAIFVPKDAGFKVVRNKDWATQDYTIMMDIKVEDAYPYDALFQTNEKNSNDGDLFISKHQIGINVNGLGYHGEIEDDTWYRILILNRDHDFCVYVNGEQVSHCGSQLCWEIDPWGFYLFCDENEEMNDTYVAEVAYWEYGLSDSEARELSGLEPETKDPYIKVAQDVVKIVDNLDFTLTVEANVPFEFKLPEWIEGIDTAPFAGSRAYSFRAQPMDKSGKRTGYITVQAEGLEPVDVEVEQTFVGDEVPEPIGRWTFDDPSDLMQCAVGRSVLTAAFKGETGPEKTDDPASAGILPVAGPTEENGAVNVPADAYLWLSADAEVLTSYTLLFDIRPSDLKGYKSLFQNDITNREDAGLFIKNNTIGRGGSSTNIGYVGEFESDRWYRILFVVQDSRAKVYIDGVKSGESPNPQDYWTLLGDALLFADNDGEEGPVDVADIRLWDFPLSDKMAKQLGDVYSDVEELFIVQTTGVRLVDETDFSITVNSNLPVSFELPDWIEPIDVESFNGEKDYTFRAQPLEEEGRRSDFIVVEAGYLPPQEVEVTQIKLGDSMPAPMGCWTFDNAADLFAGTGEATLSAAFKDEEGFAATSDFASVGIGAIDGPLAGNGAITIPVDAALMLTNNVGVEQLRDFSILYDIRPSTLVGWNALYQKDVTNKLDAGLFIKNGMLGVSEAGLGYHGSLVPSKWHRVLFVVKRGYATLYLDGEKVGQSTGSSSNWTMLSDVLLFIDNDGEVKDNDVAEIRFWDVPLTAAHAKELGAVEQEWEGESPVEPVSVWTFDNPSNLLEGTGSATLRAAVKGNNGPELVDDLAAAGFESIPGPASGNGALSVPFDRYLQLAHNEGGDLNSFSMMMDIRPKSLSGYNAIFQSHVNNDEDGSLYTKGTQIGINISGLGYGGELVEGMWHRIVFVVDENRMSVYIDGLKVLATYSSNSDRWILHEVGWIFTDDDGEEGAVDIAELRFWDTALPVEQVVQMGAVDVDTSIGNIQISDDRQPGCEGIYDLTGRCFGTTDKLQKGLYIVNGQKVLIR